jgi:hypothetical protein
VVIGLAIGVPRDVRDASLGLCVGFLLCMGMGGARAAVFIIAMMAYYLSLAIPGSGTVIVLGAFVIAHLVASVQKLAQARRLASARAWQPGASGLVTVEGELACDLRDRAAAELLTAHGRVLVDASTIRGLRAAKPGAPIFAAGTRLVATGQMPPDPEGPIYRTAAAIPSLVADAIVARDSAADLGGELVWGGLVALGVAGVSFLAGTMQLIFGA